MTNGYTIPMDRLFANQSTYGDMDLESQRIREEEQLRSEMAKKRFEEIMSPPFRQSLLTEFAPAEMENIQLIPDAEPYSALSVKQAPSSIVGGMFSPEISRAAEMQYLQDRQKAMRDRALAFAQLSPMQQADYGFYRGGQQLGDVVGGALGGQDPQLRMIGLQQQILSELDPSDPQQQLRVAQKYAQTAPDLAMKIADNARSSLIKIAQANKEQKLSVSQPLQVAARIREINAAQRNLSKDSPEYQDLELEKTQLQKAEKQEATPNEIQIATSFALRKGERGTPEFNQEFYDQLTRLTTKDTKENIKEVGVAEGTRAPVYLDVNNDTQFTYQKGADGKQIRVPYVGGVDRTTAKVSATASSAGDTAFTKQLAELDAKKVAQAIETRDNAISSLNSLNRLNQLNQQDLISGTFATGRLGATNLLQTLGLVSGKDIDRLSASENYQKTAGDVILATLGGRLGAGFSNEDRKFIQSLVPQLENSPQARKQLIEFMVLKNQSIVDETTRLENYAREKSSLKGYVPKIPIVNIGTSSLKNLSDDELLKQAKEKGIIVKPKQ